MAALLHSTIKLLGSLEFASRMEEMSHGAGRKERQPLKLVGALIGREAISAAELHVEAVIEGMDMFTTVACLFAPRKRTKLLIR